MIDERETLLASKDNRKCIKILAEDPEEYTAQVVSPIICEGDAIGAVILFSKDAKVKMGEVEQKVAMSAAGFLGRQMEQ